VEPSSKKAISKKTNVRSSREGSEDRKSDEEKRTKTPSRKHMCSCTESEPDTSELIKSIDKRKDYARGKSLRKKLESMVSYSSMKSKGHSLMIELFKMFDFSSDKIKIICNSLAPSTYLNYQFGWGIFAEFIMHGELWFDIKKENVQEIYNNFLVYLQEIKEDNNIEEEESSEEIENNNNNNNNNKPKQLKNIKPSLFRGAKFAVSWLFKQLFLIDVANNFNAKAYSRSFCKQFPIKAKYQQNVWDCSIMLNYYRNYTESLIELPAEERLLAIHNFYLVKSAILILFYGLLRF
jgi:hypothetical protein